MTAPPPGLDTGRLPGGLAARRLVDRLGPTGIAAIVAGVLVLFGLGAVVVPSLTAGGGTSNAERAAPPAAQPQAAPSSAPAAASSAPPVTSATPTTAQTTLVAASFNTGYEDRVVQLINGERRKKKCEALKVDNRLRGAARTHAADMAARDFTGSRGSDGSDAAGRVRAAGFTGFADELTAKGGDAGDVVKHWMHGDAQDKLLDCGITSIGVGAAMRGRTPYWTVDTGRA
ncbi:CAP domain-containing protein [Dactylosporangium sp. CA-139066]|uniref:CAP domain-containing protein n=1 Tax=Dactylosporangium sp. CA-139066 TaxID=3239930 RepID=UPI003D8D3E95